MSKILSNYFYVFTIFTLSFFDLSAQCAWTMVSTESSLTVTSEDICTVTVLIEDLICVDPNPVADFSFSPMPAYSHDPLVTFTNNSTLNHSNSWFFGDDEVSDLESPKHECPEGEVGSYLAELKVYTQEGCSGTTRLIVPVNGQTVFYGTNSFTPNGDEFNNVFIPVMITGFDPSDYEFRIYNRWGEMIFVAKDHRIGWDGTYQGKVIQDGTYSWTIDFKHVSNDGRFF